VKVAVLIFAWLFLVRVIARLVWLGLLDYPRVLKTSRSVDAFAALVDAGIAATLFWLTWGAS